MTLGDTPDGSCEICGANLLADLTDYAAFAMGRSEYTPFLCKECGGMRFPIRAIRDIVFVKPEPVENFPHSDIIVVPDILKAHTLSGFGFILSVGPGYQDNKGRFWPTHTITIGKKVVFDKDVADLFTFTVKDYDDSPQKVVACGFGDIKAVVLED
jgi:co-chaperonin GroES (HSP10)